jgi:hypothetical protein
MQIRIRLGRGPRLRRQGRKNRHLALAMASLMTPAALMAFSLAIWRIAADMKWARAFAFSGGILSHWQVWVAVALLLQILAVLLNRYGSTAGES